jgi:hypothetical protein
MQSPLRKTSSEFTNPARVHEPRGKFYTPHRLNDPFHRPPASGKTLPDLASLPARVYLGLKQGEFSCHTQVTMACRYGTA